MVLCDDPDAPSGTWHHRAGYDIPLRVTASEADASRHAQQLGFLKGVNDFHRTGYGGPCPPHGHGPHRYHFRVLALSIEPLPRWSGRPAHLLAEALVTGICA